ncbi:MAG: hypothetical protein E7812_03895 [Phenylobacterium sp.]|nr:MAG: hypothetical protein E7812_03895 [Phenylobacterium sp.]
MKRLLWIAASLAVLLAAPAAFAQEAPGPAPADPSFWSRVTVEVPAYTHHVPHDDEFNDRNTGLFVDYALTPSWSLVGGDFENSYRRNTAFAAVSWEPLTAHVAGLRLAAGGMVGLDLNGGYRGFNEAEPLLGAVNLRLTAANPDADALHRLGLLLTVIPAAPGGGGATAFNLAVTYRLP